MITYQFKYVNRGTGSQEIDREPGHLRVCRSHRWVSTIFRIPLLIHKLAAKRPACGHWSYITVAPCRISNVFRVWGFDEVIIIGLLAQPVEKMETVIFTKSTNTPGGKKFGMHCGQRVSLPVIILALVVADLCPLINAWSFKLIAIRKNWFRRARTRPFIDTNKDLEYYPSTSTSANEDMDFLIPRIDRGAIVTGSLPHTVSSKKASKWDLPRHSDAILDNPQNKKLLWDIELFLGRTAMVSAIFLLFGEIMSRESMPSQLASLFTGHFDSVFAVLP